MWRRREWVWKWEREKKCEWEMEKVKWRKTSCQSIKFFVHWYNENSKEVHHLYSSNRDKSSTSKLWKACCCCLFTNTHIYAFAQSNVFTSLKWHLIFNCTKRCDRRERINIYVEYVPSEVMIYFHMDNGSSCSCINEHSFVRRKRKILNFETNTHNRTAHICNRENEFLQFYLYLCFHFSRLFQQINRIFGICIDVCFFFSHFRTFANAIQMNNSTNSHTTKQNIEINIWLEHLSWPKKN